MRLVRPGPGAACGMGAPLLAVPRSSKTLIEYPVVADVDNDGSAESVVVSDLDFNGNQPSPTVQLIRDIEDRWIQPRRIWNQHTYHITNIPPSDAKAS